MDAEVDPAPLAMLREKPPRERRRPLGVGSVTLDL
jgi:hypothetical protein